MNGKVNFILYLFVEQSCCGRVTVIVNSCGVNVGTQIKVVLTYQLDTSTNDNQESTKLDLHNKWILLVEDNEINMEVAEYLLV